MPVFEKGKIWVTHLNIRPSISLLITQLIMLQVLVGVILIGGYLGILQLQNFISEILKSYLGLFILWGVFLLQLALTIYATLAWVNEYYEITPTTIIHKKGIFFRKVQKYSLENLMYLSIEQGILGTLLNFGTLAFLSPRREPLVQLYNIHNPNKYMEVLESLKKTFGREEHFIRGEVKEDEYKEEYEGEPLEEAVDTDEGGGDEGI